MAPYYDPAGANASPRANEARWLLTRHAANLLHAARPLIRHKHRRLWSRQRFRGHVLEV